MTNEEARLWLNEAWHEARANHHTARDPEMDRLTNSKVNSIRYALVTQILGKIADSSRSLFALQLKAEGSDSWDARSFSTAVVVPWAGDNQNVLGTSADPYASKPLRRTRLTANMEDVRDREEWNALVKLFERLEHASPSALKQEFRRVLLSMVRKLAKQTFTYAIPQRISQSQLDALLCEFLAASSGGLRPLAIATALFRTLGEGFSLFNEVQSQGVNEADSASGMPGDIMCYDNNGIYLVVEVKDVKLTLGHVRASIRKARESESRLKNLLFTVPGVAGQDANEIDALAKRTWASGMNVYTVEIRTLSRYVFSLLKEEWRVRFLREICRELDDRQNQAARAAWHDLLLSQV